MPEDLDLALRVTADIQQARQQLTRLNADIRKTSADVAQASARQAAAATQAAAAQSRLTDVQNRAARENTDAARAALDKARADNTAAQAALRAARGETQAAQARAAAARTAQQAATALDRQTAAQNRANAATARSGRAFGRVGPQIQNASFQIADFAVQVTAGTSAARAAAQQMPQFLGAFGVAGAVLGALTAVAVPVAAALFRLGEDARDAADASEDLADQAERLQSLRERVRDAEGLAEAYGKATAQARALIDAQRDLAERAAESALDDVVSSFGDVLGARGVPTARQNLENESELQRLVSAARRQLTVDADELVSKITKTRNDAKKALREIFDPEELERVAAIYGDTVEGLMTEIALELQKPAIAVARETEDAARAAEKQTKESAQNIVANLGLTGEAAREVLDAFVELKKAEGFDERAAALGRFRAALTAVGVEAAEQSEEQRRARDELIAGILDTEDKTLRLVAAGDEIPRGIQEAARAARDLAAELGRAAEAGERALESARFRQRRARAELDFADDPEALRRELRQIAQDQAAAPLEAKLREGGLIGVEVSRATEEIRRLAGEAADAEFEARRLKDQLRDAGRAGTDGGQDAADAMDDLAAANKRAAERAGALQTATQQALSQYAADLNNTRDEVVDAWESGFQGLEDALVRFVETGKLSFSDLANSILRDLTRIAIRTLIIKPLIEAITGGLGSPQAPTSSPRPRARGDVFHRGGVVPGRGDVHATLEGGEAVLTRRQVAAVFGYSGSEEDRRRGLNILHKAAAGYTYTYHQGGVAGLPAGAVGSGGFGGAGGSMKVDVSVNNTGAPKHAQSADVRFDPRGLIVRVFLDDLARGGPMARGIQRVVPGMQL